MEIIGGGLIIPAVLSRIKAAAGVPEHRSLDSQSCRSLGAGLFSGLFYQGEGEGFRFKGEGLEYELEDGGLEEILRGFGEEVGGFEEDLKEEMEMCKRDEVCLLCLFICVSLSFDVCFVCIPFLSFSQTKPYRKFSLLPPKETTLKKQSFD